MSRQSQDPLGRTAVKIAEIVRAGIRKGEMTIGQFLMSERDMAARHSVDKKTVRRALKSLEAEGLIRAFDRHGYRVISGLAAADRGGPVAYIPSESPDVATWHVPAALILPALQEAGNRMGWSLLATGSRNRPAPEVVAEVRSMKCSGVVMDDDKESLLSAIREAGVPAVLVDTASGNSDMDCVMQDGQMGGAMAARHLLLRGCRRIAWFGPQVRSPHNTDRFSGVVAALDEQGLSLPPALNIKTNDEHMTDRARELLGGSERPDGVVACWSNMSALLARTAKELGLKLDKDLHLVGWCPEEAFDAYYRPAFGSGPVVPAVTWSVRAMAETAIARLAERRRCPGLPPVRIKIPTKLRIS